MSNPETENLTAVVVDELLNIIAFASLSHSSLLVFNFPFCWMSVHCKVIEILHQPSRPAPR